MPVSLDPVGLIQSALTPSGGHAGGLAKTSTISLPAEKDCDFPSWLTRPVPVLSDLLDPPVLGLRFCSRKLSLVVTSGWSSLPVGPPAGPGPVPGYPGGIRQQRPGPDRGDQLA